MDRSKALLKQIQENFEQPQKDSDYKNLQALYLLNPALLDNLKTGFASQLQFVDQTQKKNLQAKYRYSDQKTKLIHKNVDKYIKGFSDQKQKLYSFKNVLRSRLQQAKNQINYFGLEQLSFKFPWLMSSAVLFQPLRTLIYCFARNLPPQKLQQIQKSIPGAMINVVVNQAIYNCTKYGQKTIQLAIQVIKGSSESELAKPYQSTVVKILKSIAHPFRTLYRWAAYKNLIQRNRGAINTQKVDLGLTGIISKINPVEAAQNNLDVDVTEGLTKFLPKLATAIFEDLRCYGQIVINFDFIKSTASYRTIGGQNVYYYPQNLGLMFSITNSFPKVFKYFSETNTLVQIPQGQFNVQFLRKIALQSTTKFTGRLFQNIDYQINNTAEQKLGLTQFATKYLDWGEEKVIKNRWTDIKTKIDLEKKNVANAKIFQKLFNSKQYKDKFKQLEQQALKKTWKVGDADTKAGVGQIVKMLKKQRAAVNGMPMYANIPSTDGQLEPILTNYIDTQLTRIHLNAK